MKIGGCYSLRKDLGKLGENPIWLASDEVLGKDVTLHFVPTAVVRDARAMAELRQEVKRNRQLIHPNILRVYDLVEDGDRVAISMDCFEGETLAEQLKKNGSLNPDDVKPWISQLAETLADAHRIQLFHRDLAPDNLYLRPSGGLLVTNFGISRVILTALERAGVAKGDAARLAYLSPQQLDGERVAATDDIYGFGVLLYELLAGKRPFVGENLVPQIRKTVPPLLAEARSAAGLSSPVPASWQKLVAACLEKTPEMRPRNLVDVLALIAQDSGPARSHVAVTPSVLQNGEVSPEANSEAGNEVKATVVPQKEIGPDVPLEKTADAPSGGNGAGASAIDEPRLNEEKHVESSSSRMAVESGVPPTPPDGHPPAIRKSPVKGALSANFPDLERPRSKAPLFLVLFAVVIAVGMYIKNMPPETDGDADAAVARIDGQNPGENPETPQEVERTASVASTPASSEKVPGAPDSQAKLPDPDPITPTPAVAQVSAVSQAPKSVATPAPKPTVEPATVSSDPAPLFAGAAVGVVPDDLATASAAGGGKQTPAPQHVAAVTPRPQEKPPKSPAAPVLPAKVPERSTPPATSSQIPTLPNAPTPLAKLALSAKPTVAELQKAAAERAVAIKEILDATIAAEAVQKEVAPKLDSAKSLQSKMEKAGVAKRKTLAPIFSQAEMVETEQKRLQSDAAKAQTAATHAATVAEAAKRKYEEVSAKNEEKIRAREQAQAELQTAATELASVGKDIDELSNLLSKTDSLRQHLRTAQQQVEQEAQKIAAASEQLRRAEMEAQRKANDEKIAALEKQVKDLEAQVSPFKAALGPLKELGEAGKEASLKIEEKMAGTNRQVAELRTEIKRLSGDIAVLSPKTTGMVAPPNSLIEPPVQPPPQTETPSGQVTLPAKDGAAVNSLGMKFVPIGDVQFSVYLTTRADFEAFATATNLKSDAWRNPGFKQDPDHPVVNVTWRETEAFCKWLTEKERKAGMLKSGESYRLPTDAEWSKAVGLPQESGATPEMRDMGVQDVYPWGNQWPPPAGAGNYAGEETQTEIPIPNYNDGYPNTSPVGKFPANKQGLHDMGGNVWQWVSDYWNTDNRAKTLRGGSWYNGAIPLSLLSSCRISSSPDTLHDTYGFRVVRASEGTKGRRKN